MLTIIDNQQFKTYFDKGLASKPKNLQGIRQSNIRELRNAMKQHINSDNAHKEAFKEAVIKKFFERAMKYPSKSLEQDEASFTSTEHISKSLRYFSVRNRSDGTQFVEEREITLRRSLFDSERSLDLAKEEDRLATFSNWQHDSIVTGEQLASRGFSYLGEGDRVRCVFCKGILRDWRKGDDALVEHHQHFPTCPFILHLDVGNIARASKLTDTLKSAETCSENSPPVYTPCPSEYDATASLTAIQFEDYLQTISTPSYNGIEQRIKSFRDKDGLLPSFQIFAAVMAGFYRVAGSEPNVTDEDVVDGEGDSIEGVEDGSTDDSMEFDVCCFACNLVIHFKSVSPNELNMWWKAHAEKNRTCPYVKLHYKRFHQSKPSGPAVVSQQPLSTRRHRIEPREVRARLDLPLYYKLQTIFQEKLGSIAACREMLSFVISERLEIHGEDFRTPFEAFTEFERNVNEFYDQHKDDSTFAIKDYVDNKKAAIERAKEQQRLENRRRQEEIEKSQRNVDVDNFQSMSERALADLNQQLKDNRTCKICMDKIVNTVFLPCGHLVTCQECAPKVKMCPVCRLPISSTVLTTL